MSADANLPVFKDDPALPPAARLKRIEELRAQLRELVDRPSGPCPQAASERVTRGYKVRRSCVQLSEEQRKARQDVTLQAIAQALAKMRG